MFVPLEKNRHHSRLNLLHSHMPSQRRKSPFCTTNKSYSNTKTTHKLPITLFLVIAESDFNRQYTKSKNE